MNAITRTTSVAVLVALGLALATMCLIGSAVVAAEPNGTTNRWPVVHVGERDAYDPEFKLVCASRVRNGAKPAEALSSLADFPMHAANAYADMAVADVNHPHERVDGNKPVNNRYNASVGPLMGMGRPATIGVVPARMTPK